jgi:hypothetical protein
MGTEFTSVSYLVTNFVVTYYNQFPVLTEMFAWMSTYV